MSAEPDSLANKPVMSATPLPEGDSAEIIHLNQPVRPQPTTIRNASQTTPNARHRFRYAGQTWTILKRTTAPDAPYYIEFERQKTRYRASLRTSSKAHAEAEAKAHIDAWLKRSRDERAGYSRTASKVTLGQIFAVLPTLAIRSSAKGRQAYAWATRWVILRALKLKTESEVDNLPATILNAQTARAYFVAILDEANHLPTQAAQNKLKRTALKIFDFSKCLVSPLAVESMTTDHKLTLPNFDAWRKASRTGSELLNPASAAEFQAPDDATLRRTFRAWLALGRTPGYVLPYPGNKGRRYEGKPLPEWLRRNMFIAAGLMVSAGLRKSEVPKARWNWWKTFNGVPHLSERDVDTKGGTNEIHVVPVDPFWTLFNRIVDRNGWRGEPEDHCLTARQQTDADHPNLRFKRGGNSDRLTTPFYHIGRWLRSLGWKMQKSNHALRDYTASMVTMRFGLDAAKDFCRHSQISTTEGHYNRFRSLAKQVKPETIAWFNWAGVP